MNRTILLAGAAALAVTLMGTLPAGAQATNDNPNHRTRSGSKSDAQRPPRDGQQRSGTRGGATGGQTPANQAPANQTPANQTPANQAPANQTPGNRTPSSDGRTRSGSDTGRGASGSEVRDDRTGTRPEDRDHRSGSGRDGRDGARSDGARSDGARSDGARSDGTRGGDYRGSGGDRSYGGNGRFANEYNRDYRDQRSHRSNGKLERMRWEEARWRAEHPHARSWERARFQRSLELKYGFSGYFSGANRGYDRNR